MQTLTFDFAGDLCGRCNHMRLLHHPDDVDPVVDADGTIVEFVSGPCHYDEGHVSPVHVCHAGPGDGPCPGFVEPT